MLAGYSERDLHVPVLRVLDGGPTEECGELATVERLEDLLLEELLAGGFPPLEGSIDSRLLSFLHVLVPVRVRGVSHSTPP